MLSGLDNFYFRNSNEVNDCLLALRKIILDQDDLITAELKYHMPFFCYRGKMFCYLWIEQGSGRPYMGFVEGKHLNHPDLILGERARMKILFVDPDKDLPIEMLNDLLQQALNLYRTGKIKTKKA